MNCYCYILWFPCRDLEDTLLPIYKGLKHSNAINCIDGVAGINVGCGAPEIVTGSKDGKNR